MSKVFRAICKKTWKTEPKTSQSTIYHRIEVFQRKHNILTTTLAQNAYAYDVMHINVRKLGLKKEEIEEMQNWLDKKVKPVTQDSKEERKEVKIREIRKKVADVFGLPPNLVKEANKMADVYPDIYVLENLVRHVVKTVLEERYGSDWWKNHNVISSKIAGKVEERMIFEGKNRWVAKRGTHEIFYTNFGDLSRIIASNPTEFREIFANMEIEAELRKLEPSRNIIAHNNPLPPKEINRIKTCLDDLQEQLKNYTEKKTIQS